MYFPTGNTEAPTSEQVRKELEYASGLKEKPTNWAKIAGGAALVGFFVWMVTR